MEDRVSENDKILTPYEREQEIVAEAIKELIDLSYQEAQEDVPIKTYAFSFGPDHTDPDTGESLGGKYVVVQDRYYAARLRVFKEYGRGWCAQYLMSVNKQLLETMTEYSKPLPQEECSRGCRRPCRHMDWSPEERAEYDRMYD